MLPATAASPAATHHRASVSDCVCCTRLCPTGLAVLRSHHPASACSPAHACLPLPVLQVIDVKSQRLQNVITFPPSGAFIVDSSIQVEGPQRVAFKFTAAKLKTASKDWGVPPFGQGWCVAVHTLSWLSPCLSCHVYCNQHADTLWRAGLPPSDTCAAVF